MFEEIFCNFSRTTFGGNLGACWNKLIDELMKHDDFERWVRVICECVGEPNLTRVNFAAGYVRMFYAWVGISELLAMQILDELTRLCYLLLNTSPNS